MEILVVAVTAGTIRRFFPVRHLQGASKMERFGPFIYTQLIGNHARGIKFWYGVPQSTS
jgi:hypothetical protein